MEFVKDTLHSTHSLEENRPKKLSQRWDFGPNQFRIFRKEKYLKTLKMQEEIFVMFVKYFECFEYPKFLSEKISSFVVVVFQPIGRNGIFYTSSKKLK